MKRVCHSRLGRVIKPLTKKNGSNILHIQNFAIKPIPPHHPATKSSIKTMNTENGNSEISHFETSGPKNNKKFMTRDPKIDTEIEVLANKLIPNTDPTHEHLRQMLTTVALLSKEGTSVGDIRMMNNQLKELRHALRIFAPYKDKYKVDVFGSARTSPYAHEYKAAESFAQKIVKQGWMVITGGGPGIMEAGNKGAGLGNSFALNIELPQEQHPNPHVNQDQSVNFKYFFTRKVMFVKESDATVLLPGGWGTDDEGYETLTLLQCGKMDPRPIVMLDSKKGTFWKKWLAFTLEHKLETGYISQSDLSLFTVTNSVDKAIKECLGFYSVYDSIRRVRDKFVIRLKSPISDEMLADLNKFYSPLLASGSIDRCGATQEEIKQNDRVGLERISLDFNRKDYGLLTAMIRTINGFPQPKISLR